MPILVSADFPGVSPEAYEKTHKTVMTTGQPDGMIAHCATEKNGGLAVVDIWESREKFEAFVKEVVAPVLQANGAGAEPENVTITDLLNADAYSYTGPTLSD